MSKSKKWIYKSTIIFSLTGMLGLFTHCAGDAPPEQGTSAKSVVGPTPASVVLNEEQLLNSLQTTTGVKNFEQILSTMSVLTGVDAMNSSIQTTYKQVQASLPTDNDVKVFSTSHQIAVTKLASEFCNSLVESTTLRAVIWPTFNFGANLNANPFTTANREYIIGQAVLAFWGIVTDAEVAEAVELLSPVFDDLMAGESMTTSTSTKNVVKGICVCALSSAHVNFF